MNYIVFECGKRRALPFKLEKEGVINVTEAWRCVGLCVEHNEKSHGLHEITWNKTFENLTCHWWSEHTPA